MAPSFLQSLSSIAPSHLICISGAFSTFKTKKTEPWHSLGRMEGDFNFLDFENPNSVIAVTTPSEIHALTSIFFLIIPTQIDDKLTYIFLERGPWAVDYLVLHTCLWPLSITPSCRRSFWKSPAASCIAWQQMPSCCRRQSLSWYVLESDVIIRILARFSLLFTSQKSGRFRD